MPAQQKSPRDGGWGLSYADIGQAVEEHETHHNCTLEFHVHYYKKYKTATRRVWCVVAHARWNRGTPKEVCGIGECEVGSGSGAASFPGAYLSSLISACNDLEKRRANPRKAQEVAQLPLFGTE